VEQRSVSLLSLAYLVVSGGPPVPARARSDYSCVPSSLRNEQVEGSVLVLSSGDSVHRPSEAVPSGERQGIC